MTTGEDREAEHGRILLDRRLDDLRHRPADAAVDHLEAGLASPGALRATRETRGALALAPPAPGGADHAEGLGGCRRVELEESAGRAGERGRGQPLGPAVAADDHDLAPVDARQALGRAAHQ